MQCRHKVEVELCRCRRGHGQGWLIRQRGSVYSWALLIPAFNPISEKGKITPLSESARGEPSPGLAHDYVPAGISLGFLWAKVYSTESSFLSCSKGYEIHLGAINTHSSWTM